MYNQVPSLLYNHNMPHKLCADSADLNMKDMWFTTNKEKNYIRVAHGSDQTQV